MAKAAGAVAERKSPTRQAEPVVLARVINGKAVVSTEPVASNLPNAAPIRVDRHVLDDGSVVFGCAECDFVADRRGDVQVHRADEHGLGWPGRRPRGTKADPFANLSLALGMTLADVLESAGQAAEWKHLLDLKDTQISELRKRENEQLATWRERALAAEKELAKYQSAFRRLGFVPNVEDE